MPRSKSGARISEVRDESHYFLIVLDLVRGRSGASLLGGYGASMGQGFWPVPGMILSNFQISGQNGLQHRH